MNRSWQRFLPTAIQKKLEPYQHLRKAIANTGWLMGDQVFRLAAGLLVGVWLARYLGPEQQGLISYASAFTSLFAIIATLGLDEIVIREIVREPESSDEITGTAFFMKLAGGVITLIVTVIAITLTRPENHTVLLLTSILATGTIFQSFNVIDCWFQSQVAARYTVMARNASFVLIVLAKALLIFLKAPLVAFAFAGVAEIALAAGGLVLVYHRLGHRISFWRFKWSLAKSLLKYSWPLILADALITVYMRIDQIMLGSMVGDKAVGLYSVVVRISEAWYFIPGAIVASVYPVLIKLREEDREAYLQQLQRLYTFLVWLALAVAVPFTFISTFLVTALFGQQYSAAGNVLSVHIWTAVFIFYGIGKSVFIQCENMQKFCLVCTAAGAILNIVLNIYLIPRYDIMGAAIATLCAQIAASTIIPAMYKPDRINVRMFLKSFFFVSFFRKKSW